MAFGLTCGHTRDGVTKELKRLEKHGRESTGNSYCGNIFHSHPSTCPFIIFYSDILYCISGWCMLVFKLNMKNKEVAPEFLGMMGLLYVSKKYNTYCVYCKMKLQETMDWHPGLEALWWCHSTEWLERLKERGVKKEDNSVEATWNNKGSTYNNSRRRFFVLSRILLKSDDRWLISGLNRIKNIWI